MVVSTEDSEPVTNTLQSFKSRLREKHLTIVGFSRICQLTICTLDSGFPTDGDHVMTLDSRNRTNTSLGDSVKLLAGPLRRSYDCPLENDI